MRNAIKYTFTFVVFFMYNITVFGNNNDSVYITNNTKIFIVEGTKTNFLDKAVKKTSTEKVTEKKSNHKKNFSKIKKKVEIVKQIQKQLKPSFKIFISKNNSSSSISVLQSRNNVAIEITSSKKIKSNLKKIDIIGYNELFKFIVYKESIHFLYQEKYIDKFDIKHNFSRPPPFNI
ncbi:hypothetical protein [Chishuiella sp.]|uniref:hypothetical protein n=1 Tax=Chishuiella sp. TaxID=1969467 RepID=UPI0028A87602|nr:hypothetical protein [Chishuiella sp.]